MCRPTLWRAAFPRRCFGCGEGRMRVGIDAHMVGTRETGNETYCAGLVEGLTQLAGDNRYTVYTGAPGVLSEVDSVPGFERRVLRRDSSVWRLAVGFAHASRA